MSPFELIWLCPSSAWPAALLTKRPSALRATVAREQKHLLGKKGRRVAQTEIGRSIAKEMDVSASLMDRMVRYVGEEELKEYKPRGKPQ